MVNDIKGWRGPVGCTSDS